MPAKTDANVQGLHGPQCWTPIDLLDRLSTKGLLRVYQVPFARFAPRFSVASRPIKLNLQLRDERSVAYIE